MRGAQTSQIDWLTILLYFSLVIFGWLSIYAADFDPDVAQSLFSFQNSSGRQLIWILTSIGIMVIIFLLDYRVFESLAYLIYLGIFLLLVSVLFFGQEVAGSTSWFQIGGFKLQPSEFAKTATALALAKYLSEGNRNIKLTRDLVLSTLVFLLPMSLILLQGDAGTSMVFLSFVIVLFREGMSPGFILIGFGAVLVFLLTLLLPQTGLIIGIIVLTLLILGIAARSIKKALIIISLSIISIGMVV
ncbi:MAG: rod shape determining protein RodA, partial [Cyclobacteriaceae bacterium]